MKQHVVNWSEQQKCFHIETVEEMLARNQDNFEHCAQVDFTPIAFAASFSEANKIAETYRQKRGIPFLQDRIPK